MSGTGRPGSTVTVAIDGCPILQTVVETNGNWTVTSAPGMTLAPGRYGAVVTMIGTDGCRSQVRTVICVQSGSLTPPTVDFPTGTTTDTTPAFGGRGIPGATVHVILEGVGSFSTTVDQHGFWRLVSPVTLAFASYTFRVFQSIHGNVSPSVSRSFTVVQST